MLGGLVNQDDHAYPATQWLKNEFCVSGRYTPWAMIFSLHNFFHFPRIQQSLFWTSILFVGGKLILSIHHPPKAWGMQVGGREGVAQVISCPVWHLLGCRRPSGSWLSLPFSPDVCIPTSSPVLCSSCLMPSHPGCQSPPGPPAPTWLNFSVFRGTLFMIFHATTGN